MSKQIQVIRNKKTSLDRAFGKFLIDVKTAGHMAEGDDSQGGALVPDRFEKRIMAYGVEHSIVRPRAQIFHTDSDNLHVPRLVDSDRSADMFGGITFKWLPEKGDKEAVKTKPAVGQLGFTPHKLVGTVWTSNELENDIEGFGRFMNFSFGRALSFIQDYHFFHGTGGGQPLGILNSTALGTVARNAVGYIDLVDFGELAKLLCADSWLDPGIVWMINSDALGEYFGLTAPAANGAAIINLNDPNILGKPLIISSLAASLGDPGDLGLFNLSYYAIADRSLKIAASPDQDIDGRGYLTDETLWKIVWRGDGKPIVDAAIIPKIGGNAVSPFVVLTSAS